MTKDALERAKELDREINSLEIEAIRFGSKAYEIKFYDINKSPFVLPKCCQPLLEKFRGMICDELRKEIGVRKNEFNSL